MDINYQRDVERFLRYDQELRELNAKCAEVRSKRQKYHAKLLRQSDTDLHSVGMRRLTSRQYQPLTQNFLLTSLQAYFKKDQAATQCLDFVLNRRQKSKRERVELVTTPTG